MCLATAYFLQYTSLSFNCAVCTVYSAVYRQPVPVSSSAVAENSLAVVVRVLLDKMLLLPVVVSRAGFRNVATVGESYNHRHCPVGLK